MIIFVGLDRLTGSALLFNFKIMMKKSFLVFPLAACLALSCNEALREDQLLSDDLRTAKTKTVKLGDEFDKGSFLVKFASVPDDAMIGSLMVEGVESVERLFTSTPGKEELEARFGLDRWYEVKVAEGARVDDMIRQSALIESVSVVEYNCLAQKDVTGDTYYAAPDTKAASSGFNDPYLPDQWHYRNGGGAVYGTGAVKGGDINVYDVWNTLGVCGDPDIIVAIVDEGVKYTHPDLAANMWVNKNEIPNNGIDDDKNGYVDDVYGYNFVDNTNQISWDKDGDTGHGTHTGGTVAAVNNNGIGVCGVAGGSGKGDGCRLMSCQIFSGNGGGNTSVISRAVKYAGDNGASIISCSFGTPTSIPTDNAYLKGNSAEIDAIHYFEACQNNTVLNGGIAIFSSGNETHPYAHYPGAFVDIISVSAIAADMLPTNYTDYGPGCNIAAPGGEMGLASTFKSMVLSTVPRELEEMSVDNTLGSTDYGYMQGTSMACPHVSGVVALGLAYAKKLGKKFDRDEFKQLILSSTNDIDQKIAVTKEKTYQNCPIAGTNKYYKAHAALPMAPYYHQMGTGAIDAWQLMMQIEGIPTLVAKLDKTDYIDLSPYFGTSSVSLTYLSVEVPQSTVESLGLQSIKASNTQKYAAVPEEGYAYVQYGRLYMHPTKVGSGKITIHVVGGGDHLGGGNNPTGGMELVQEVSVISREVKATNGGWM